MGAVEVGADAISDLLGAEQASGLDDGPFAMDPFRLNRVEPGTLDRQEARQDAHALACCLTWRLCARIQARTRLLTCQEALSQISSHTRTPVSCRRAQPHARNCSVMALTGRPSTKRSQTRSGCWTWRSSTP